MELAGYINPGRPRLLRKMKSPQVVLAQAICGKCMRKGLTTVLLCHESLHQSLRSIRELDVETWGGDGSCEFHDYERADDRQTDGCICGDNLLSILSNRTWAGTGTTLYLLPTPAQRNSSTLNHPWRYPWKLSQTKSKRNFRVESGNTNTSAGWKFISPLKKH